MYKVVTFKLQEWHTTLYQNIRLSVLFQHIEQIDRHIHKITILIILCSGKNINE